MIERTPYHAADEAPALVAAPEPPQATSLEEYKEQLAEYRTTFAGYIGDTLAWRDELEAWEANAESQAEELETWTNRPTVNDGYYTTSKPGIYNRVEEWTDSEEGGATLDLTGYEGDALIETGDGHFYFMRAGKEIYHVAQTLTKGKFCGYNFELAEGEAPPLIKFGESWELKAGDEVRPTAFPVTKVTLANDFFTDELPKDFIDSLPEGSSTELTHPLLYGVLIDRKLSESGDTSAAPETIQPPATTTEVLPDDEDVPEMQARVTIRKNGAADVAITRNQRKKSPNGTTEIVSRTRRTPLRPATAAGTSEEETPVINEPVTEETPAEAVAAMEADAPKPSLLSRAKNAVQGAYINWTARKLFGREASTIATPEPKPEAQTPRRKKLAYALGTVAVIAVVGAAGDLAGSAAAATGAHSMPEHASRVAHELAHLLPNGFVEALSRLNEHTSRLLHGGQGLEG